VLRARTYVMGDGGYVFLAFLDLRFGFGRGFLDAITKPTRLIVANPPLTIMPILRYESIRSTSWI